LGYISGDEYGWYVLPGNIIQSTYWWLEHISGDEYGWFV